MSMIRSLYNKEHEDLKVAEVKKKKNIIVHLETFHFFESNLTEHLTLTNITSTHFFFLTPSGFD
jgi:hypothetical protein